MGGEKHQSFTLLLRHRGSPPHGRGKVFRLALLRLIDRITPAWAGKSIVKAFVQAEIKDHPRMGGEKGGSHYVWDGEKGSPPHGRGKDVRAVVGRNARGITPAWAGKRDRGLARAGHLQDHPRMGGEKLPRLRTACRRRGSPPHGRGKVRGVRQIIAGTGITPAWAGKSSSARSWKLDTRDHPRMGGEKMDEAAVSDLEEGSPPHGRGKARSALVFSAMVGITPAWAGKSFD